MNPTPTSRRGAKGAHAVAVSGLEAHHEDRLLVKASSLFDPDWYVAQYPEVAESGVDPVEHYLQYGTAGDYTPGPEFDAAWYLAQNPEVAAAGLNPLLHYLRQGAGEGRMPRDPVSPNARRTAARALASVMHLDPELFARSIDFDALPGRDGLSRGRLYDALKALFASFDTCYERLVFMPWLAMGGTELHALNALSAAIDRYGPSSTLLIITDTNCMEAKELVPAAAHLRIFSEYNPDLTPADRTCLVRCLIQGIKPRSILTANSRACWEAIRHAGRALSAYTDLYALLFCCDDTQARPCDYAEVFLRTCLPYFKKVYIDNQKFAKKIISDYGIPPTLQAHIAVVSQPASEAANTMDSYVRAFSQSPSFLD